LIVLPLMPDLWWARMHTIETYDQDRSALGRLNAWGMAWNLARDKIPFGGGMDIYTPEVFLRYAPDPTYSLAAHSIYFQVMGEQGFVGLFLFLLTGALTWRLAAGLIKRAVGSPEDQWAGELGAMVQVSLVGYAVGGAFLSLAWFDLPYDMMAAAVVASLILKPRVRVPRLIGTAVAPSAQTPVSAVRDERVDRPAPATSGQSFLQDGSMK
jgi:putative inorganic carbon (hco3(-)) transporter